MMRMQPVLMQPLRSRRLQRRPTELQQLVVDRLHLLRAAMLLQKAQRRLRVRLQPRLHPVMVAITRLRCLLVPQARLQPAETPRVPKVQRRPTTQAWQLQ